jgi:hypothetical protein
MLGMIDSSSSVSRDSFSTGSNLFDGEWYFGTPMMGAMGHSQVALAQPTLQARCKAAAEHDLHGMLSPACRAFDRDIWGGAPLTTLAHTRGHHHAAYLGLHESSSLSDLRDRSEKLIELRRFARSPSAY